ncbi:hypothetical protein RB8095 [Rhodopirellula baltica SH 1]|uniref:Uncharacterized protein n=1 Tax=Rhodopirellula baltica (strain DSM 10527 / NCIMB 13988 / SH1) TaxID=243090 RepID=Q7UG63_RHOBA|nr:hypothetical protein RB8095 [Rhodopirellula baltica SH 1]
MNNPFRKVESLRVPSIQATASFNGCRGRFTQSMPPNEREFRNVCGQRWRAFGFHFRWFSFSLKNRV